MLRSFSSPPTMRRRRTLVLLAVSAIAHSQSATPTTTSKSFQITPPVACPGMYYTYGGVCCNGNRMLDCSYSDIHDGYQEPSSCCPLGQFVWALPLSDADIAAATANGTYTGCPGNMREGLCCSGGVIYRDDSDADICSVGTAVFTVTTLQDGSKQTSSFPPGPTTTSLVGASKAPSATPSGAAARTALDVRILGGAAVALGALL
ncbi:hypothetical protein C8R43DRAFT_403188 [Mycena crocata]|nr:hypothetical protein C8R43DRAFT_403188 [Mycena crocata]